MSDAAPPPPSLSPPVKGSPPSLSPLNLSLMVSFLATATLGFNLSEHIYTADGLEQLIAAQCLLNGDSPCPGMAYWPPLLPALIALITPLLASTEAAGRLLALGAAGWVAGAVTFASARLGASLGVPWSRSIAVLSGLAVFAVPALLFFASMVDNRPIYLLTLALTLALGVAYLWPPRRNPALALALGALAILASLARPEGMAVIPLLGLCLALDVLLAPKGERGMHILGLSAALGMGLCTYALYALLLKEGAGGMGLSSRGWELPILHWQAYLDRGLILSLFGYTVEATPFREVMIGAVSRGDLPPPPLGERLGAFATIYWDHLPLVIQGLTRALPLWLLALAPFGLLPLLRHRAFPLTLLICGLFAPLLLLPGLPQSADPNLPSGSFLSALPSLGILSALGLGQLLAWSAGFSTRLGLRSSKALHLGSPWLGAGLFAGLSVVLIDHALEEAERFTDDFHLFEGEALPRGAGLWLASIAPEDARLVATYPGTIIAHVMGTPRTPMPSYWELGKAMEDLSDRPNIFVITSPDLYDDPLMVSAFIEQVPSPCRPVLHLRGERGEWVFACMTQAQR